ncbi:MAG: Spy/CpxP family protein refolding chaperone [candidate division WOR-3 bacterium]|nr:MAG: Spy/CpxP family protein refolding chaperone [candidate division WOR-3 bacterium]
MRIIMSLLTFLMLLFAQNFDAKDPRVIIEEVRIWRITQELDLTSEQATQLFPKLHEFRKVERDFRKQRMQLLSEMRILLHRGASNQEIRNVVEQYRAVHIKKIEQEVKSLKEMEKILTPVQQAKFLIFEDEFTREILDMIKHIKKMRR